MPPIPAAWGFSQQCVPRPQATYCAPSPAGADALALARHKRPLLLSRDCERSSSVRAGAGKQAAGGQQRPHDSASSKMEAQLDAVMQRFKGMGQPRQKAASPAPAPTDPHAVQPSFLKHVAEDSKKGAAAASRSPDVKKASPQQQEQRRLPAAASSKPVDNAPKAASQKAAPPAPAASSSAAAAGNERKQSSREAVSAAGQSTASASERPAASRGTGPVGFAAPPKAKPSTSAFKGFGPSPDEIKAALAAAAAAAAGESGKGHASSSEVSSTKPALAPRTIRIFLYCLDEAGATKAIADAKLEGQVLLETDVKKCVAVVSAKQGRNDKRVQSTQGERMAANAGIPFICVGRKMNGVNLREALLPLLSPGSRHAELAKQQAQEQARMREAAGAAIRAAKVTGFFALPLPAPASAPQPVSVAAAPTAAAASSQLPPSGEQRPSSRQPAPRSSTPAEDEGDDDMDLLLDDLEQGDEEEEEEEEEEEPVLARAPAAKTAVRRMVMGSRTRSPLKLR